jgi:hypothetical protein
LYKLKPLYLFFVVYIGTIYFSLASQSLIEEAYPNLKLLSSLFTGMSSIIFILLYDVYRMKLLRLPQDLFRVFLYVFVLISEFSWFLCALIFDLSHTFEMMVVPVLLFSILLFPFAILFYLFSRWTYRHSRHQYPHGKVWLVGLAIAFLWPIVILAVQ